MRGRLLALGLVLLAIMGFVFLRGPSPHIQIKPEVLTSVGPVNITNTMVTSWVVVAVILVGVYLLTRRWELVPRGPQNFIEAVVEAFYNVAATMVGERLARRFLPVAATIFFFVLIGNWLALTPFFNVIGIVKEQVPAAEGEAHEGKAFVMEKVDLGPLPLAYTAFSGPDRLKGEAIELGEPGAVEEVAEKRQEGKLVGEFLPILRSMNTDVNVPLALAIASGIAVEYWGITAMGLRGYGRTFFNFGRLLRGLRRLHPMTIMEGAVDAFVGILEIISHLVRIISFTFRLFGNMFAGEVVILMFTFLVPLLLTLPFYGLELFVGIVQAFIFAGLTLVFGLAAVEHAGGEQH